MTPQERHAYAADTYRQALANHKLALSLWDYVFPPWRWPKWWATSREVKRGIAETKRRRAFLDSQP